MTATKTLSVCLVALSGLVGCGLTPTPNGPPETPFAGLTPINADGAEQEFSGNIVALGLFDAGTAFRLRMEAPNLRSVLILRGEDDRGQTARYVGGGPADTEFVYSVSVPGDYFAFARFEPDASRATRAGRITLSADSRPAPPASRQAVVIEFEDGFLHNPGLWDEAEGTPAEQEFLASVSPLLQSEIMTTLRAIFAEMPIDLLSEPPASGPFSRVTFSPLRVPAAPSDIADAAQPPPDPGRPECQERVTFGEVLPDGTLDDVGNHNRDDAAIVYVGSFQGRGLTCRSQVTDSINNMVLALAQTAAHEIGHLIGLLHVEQIDLMNRSATLASLRELTFARGQVQLERLINGEVVGEVFPAIVQEPAEYIRAVLGD